MTSGLAASVLSRRFVLGPLIALAFVGAPAGQFDGSGSATPNPRAPASATPSALDTARRALTKAHEAQGVFFVDNLVYAATVGDELAILTQIEPKVKWGIEVIVQLPTEELAGSEVVIMRAPIASDGSLCIAEVSEIADAGTYYARVAGTGKCPPRRSGMPGWTENLDAGWGTA